jgi:hypothetical protein
MSLERLKIHESTGPAVKIVFRDGLTQEAGLPRAATSEDHVRPSVERHSECADCWLDESLDALLVCSDRLSQRVLKRVDGLPVEINFCHGQDA